MQFKQIIVETRENIVKVVLNRPEVYNALTGLMISELAIALEDFIKNDEMRVLIITGSGKAFCSGGDFKWLDEMKSNSLIKNREIGQNVRRVVMMIRSVEKPIIAAVNGDAIGGGVNLALACDLVVASENARFAQTFIKVGLIPDWGGLYFLPHLVGMAKAKELIFTGKMISAVEAERIGLINKVVPQGELDTTVLELAKELAESPPRAIGISKSLLHKSTESDIETILELEADAQPLLFTTKDCNEGIKAFFEKRKPQFVGE